MKPTHKECTKCHEVKLLDLYPKAPQNRDGHGGTCKVCIAAYQLRQRRKRTVRPKAISEDNKNFFRLGVMEGERRVHELEKALAILQTAIKALMEVIREADKAEAGSKAF